MGGKTKQSQRTKNNVRPSSSGRSALLLNNGKYESGVMNVAGTELPALFPTLAAPNVDPLVSLELQLCIKKLNKKDPITKTKALQELSELVSNSKVDDVVALLPSWAHFYRLLTADPDRKVREVTQFCHGSILSVCGRRVAPHLKALMPAWLQSQYDEHAPAQTHAQASLAKTFPDSKLPEVISFCKNEIICHLVDNLTGTGESAFIKKSDSPEEKEVQLVRILTSSLHGFQYTVQHLPREHDVWLWERIDNMLKANMFWKRAAHTDSRVRAAWYAAMGCVIERYKGPFAEQYGQKTLRIFIGAKETSPLAAAQLWDALLLFMYNIEEWHKYLDKSDLLGKRILDVLENGGWGDARHLTNILLPLLAHLPLTMLTKEFYISFFNALFNGLDKKTILSSKSERQSWITSLDECLRYLSIQTHDFVQEIVTSVHRKWLERILAGTHDGQIRTNLIKQSAATMAALVKYWLNQAKESQNEKYDQLIRNFWQNVGSTITTQIEKLSTDHKEIAKLIDGHILLVQTLKTSFIQETKKQQSIKFDGDSPNIVEKPKEMPQCDESIVQRYNHNLNELVEKMCGRYFEFASKKQISSPVLTPLLTLLIDFDSWNLFTGIARQFDCDSTYKLYDKLVKTWLAGDTMRCKAVVDIVYLFLKHLTEPEQDALFDSFKQFPPSVIEWCIAMSLSHPHCLSPSVRRWLRSSLVEATVSSICHRMIETGDSKAKNLLLMCLNHDATGEMIISPSAVSKILEQLSVAVSQVTSPSLEQVASVGARLCSTMCAPGLQLVTALFELSVREPRGCSSLSLETWCEVLAAWQDGLAALPDGERRQAVQNAAKMLHTRAQFDEKDMDLKQIEHIISLCPYLLSTNSNQDIKEMVDFTRVMFDITPIDPKLVQPYALRHNIVRGALNCPFEDKEVTTFITNDCTKEKLQELKKDNLNLYMNNCIFRGMYLRTILLHKVDEDLDDTWCNDLLADDYFAMEFCKLLHDFMIICSLFNAYAFWPHYLLIKQSKHRLDGFIDDIINVCTLKIKSHCLNALSELAATKGYYWSYTRRWFEGRANQVNVEKFECSREHVEDSHENTENSIEKAEDGHEKAEDNHEKAENSNEKPEDSNEKAENSHEKAEDSHEKAEDSKEKAENSHEKAEHSHEKAEGSCEKAEDSKEKAENSHEKAEHSHEKAEDSHEKAEDSCEKAKDSHDKIEDNDEKIDQEKVMVNLKSTEENQNEQQNREEKSVPDEIETLDLENMKEIVTGCGFFHTLQANDHWPSASSSPLRTKYLVMLRSFYAAHCTDGDVVGGKFIDDVTAGQADCNADVIVNAYYTHNHVMLYEKDVSSAPWSQVVSNAAIADYLAILVSTRGWDLPAHHWDFATITLCNLFTSVVNSKKKWGSTKVGLLTRAVLNLYLEIEKFISSVKAECLKRQPSDHVAHLPHEWADIFAPDLSVNMFTLIMYILEWSKKTTVSANHMAVLDVLIQCTRHTNYDLIPAPRRTGAFTLSRLVEIGASVLTEPVHYSFKYLAYELLLVLLKPMVLDDASLLASWSAEVESDEEGEDRSAPTFSLERYDEAFFKLQDLVETAVAHVEVCEETCELVEFTDVHRLAMGWFLLVEVMGQHFRLARGELKHHYIEVYREKKYTVPLLTSALRLLPPEVFAQAQDGESPPQKQFIDMFINKTPLNVYKYCSGRSVSAGACRALYWCASGAGVGEARGWRGAASPRHGRLLDNIMQAYISPKLIKEEFTLVQQRVSEIEDTEVLILWAVNELVATLTLEGRPIELHVTLSRSHPLGLPQLVAPENCPVDNTNWLIMYMGYQNGTLLNALKMWTSAVASKVERSPQCHVCYCRMHHVTGRLPNTCCRQCKNKFHVVCLRKWFRKSKRSQCPICRSSF